MQTAIVTGGAEAMSLAITEHLSAEGWRVVLVGAWGPALDAAARKIANVEAIAADVTDLDAAAAIVTQVHERHGAIAALVNAAGGREGADVGPFCDSDPASWPRITNLHLRSVIGWCRAVTPAMRQGGSIVSVVAFEGMRGSPTSAVYSAAKAGVIVMNQMLACETQKVGIRVNSVLPAPPEALPKASHQDPDHGVADAVAFLVSDRARWTNGACFDASGGWALY
jgi:NAD(P)-dependent dehydrogenase (short-subunit alcohol dehydrogenase family)